MSTVSAATPRAISVTEEIAAINLPSIGNPVNAVCEATGGRTSGIQVESLLLFM